MNPQIVVTIAVLAAAAICLTVLVRRNQRDPLNVRSDAVDTFDYQPAAPMTGLDSALRRSTDRDGTPIQQRLESTASHVESLRRADDTGPLLRRALDHVLSPEPAPAADP